MIFPEIINYLLTLRYPGSEEGKLNWVCYRNSIQTIIPLLPAGVTVNFTFKPLYGSYAWLVWASRIGTDIVPYTFSATITQYGNTPVQGIGSQRGLNDAAEYFSVVTEQETAYTSVTNLGPLAEHWEVWADFIVIPTVQDLKTILDALRRLHTSTESERLLQQAVYLLGLLSGQPQEPRPPIGGSE